MNRVPASHSNSHTEEPSKTGMGYHRKYLGSKGGRIGGIHKGRREKKVASPYSIFPWTLIHCLSLHYSAVLPTFQQLWKAGSVTYPWAHRCWTHTYQQKRPKQPLPEVQAIPQHRSPHQMWAEEGDTPARCQGAIGKAASSPAHQLAAQQRAAFLLQLPFLPQLNGMAWSWWETAIPGSPPFPQEASKPLPLFFPPLHFPSFLVSPLTEGERMEKDYPYAYNASPLLLQPAASHTRCPSLPLYLH